MSQACIASLGQHCLPAHARSAVVDREGEGCFEVTTQAWRKLSSLVETTSRRGIRRRVVVHETNEVALHGAGTGKEERWQGQGGPGG